MLNRGQSKLLDFIALQKQVKSPMKMTSLVLAELGTTGLAVYVF